MSNNEIFQEGIKPETNLDNNQQFLSVGETAVEIFAKSIIADNSVKANASYPPPLLPPVRPLPSHPPTNLPGGQTVPDTDFTLARFF